MSIVCQIHEQTRRQRQRPTRSNSSRFQETSASSSLWYHFCNTRTWWRWVHGSLTHVCVACGNGHSRAARRRAVERRRPPAPSGGRGSCSSARTTAKSTRPNCGPVRCPTSARVTTTPLPCIPPPPPLRCVSLSPNLPRCRQDRFRLTEFGPELNPRL
jgi:hypothetical protein